MDWQTYIHADRDILLGKPVVKGTHLAVDFILRLFAAGWTEQQVLDNYPTLTPEALRAVTVDSSRILGYSSHAQDLSTAYRKGQKFAALYRQLEMSTPL